MLESRTAAPEAETDAEAEPAAAGDYEGALAAIDEANIAVNRDPEANVGALEAAIERLLAFGPQIAADPKGREALDLSQLNLARALLMSEDKDRAAEVMDDVLRSAHDRKLPVKRFGPTLANFYDERRKLLELQGSGAIQIQCSVACRVVIDEQGATANSGPLLLGPHRVWIEAADGSVDPVSLTIELDTDGVTEVIMFPEGSDEPACEAVVVPPVVAPPPPPPPKRILPRWAEIGVTAIGVGAIVAGGVLLGLDGKCPKGLDPLADAPECPQLYEGTTSGIVSLGIGSALLIMGSVTLAVDEVRVGKQKGRQAMVTWQMRF